MVLRGFWAFDACFVCVVAGYSFNHELVVGYGFVSVLALNSSQLRGLHCLGSV